MLVSKQLDLCFGGVRNTGWKTEEEEEQVYLHLDEERMPTGGQVLAGVCVCMCTCVNVCVHGGLSAGKPSGMVGKRGRARER